MARRNGLGATLLSEPRAKESFVPLYATFHSPVLASATDQVSSFFANLSSELRHANAFHSNSNITSMTNTSANAMLLHTHAANSSFVAVTDSSVMPWSTLAPAGFHGLHCEKGSLTNWFGVMIQFILGIVAFSSLVFKRYFEPTFERRPWIIWIFDTSKQAIGTIFTHFFNLAVSSIPSGNYADPCFWYMFNYGLDCTVGLFTMWTGLSLLDLLMKWMGFTDYRLGDYGKIERFRLWAVQCFLYCVVQILEKLVVFGFMMLAVATISFEWLDRMTINPMLETSLALLIVPFFVNVIWFWIVDNLLMRSRRSQQRDSEDTAPYNPDAFVAPPSSMSGVDEDAVIVTTNSSGGTSGIGTSSSSSHSPESLRRSRPSEPRRKSAGGHSLDYNNGANGGAPVHAGSVRYDEDHQQRCIAEDAVADADDLQMLIMRPLKNKNDAAVRNIDSQTALQRGDAGDNVDLSRHSINLATGAVTVHGNNAGAGASNNAFNLDDDADDDVMVVSEHSSPVDDDDDGIRVIDADVPDNISNALIDVGDDQHLVVASSSETRSRRKHSSSINDSSSGQPMPAVRKHDNWRQQTPSTTSSSYPGGDRQQLLIDDVIDAVEIVPGATRIDNEHVVTNIFNSDVRQV